MAKGPEVEDRGTVVNGVLSGRYDAGVVRKRVKSDRGSGVTPGQINRLAVIARVRITLNRAVIEIGKLSNRAVFLS